MSVDSASHDDVDGLFKRLGARAGTSQYHEFADRPAVAMPVTKPASVPAPATVAAAAPPTVPAAAVAVVDNAVPVIASSTGQTPLQRLFQRLAEAPLQGSGQSPLARLRQR